jgi:CHAD domain-containing protein
MVTTAVEAEVKLDVDPGWEVPDLASVAGVARVDDGGVQPLVATYLDTADHRLLASWVTLRRRTGGHDAGWHLKLPLGGDRLEVRRESATPPREVPDDLVALVRSRTLGAPLAPVMELRTQRHVRTLHDADGTALVEVVDDAVVAQGPVGEAMRWREVEVELLDGSRADLDATVAALLAAGARPAASGSKLARALGSPPARAAVMAPGTVPGLLLTRLREQVGVLVDREAQVRLDRPEAVHDLRVAVRRLRSALVTFRVLGPARTAHLRAELRVLGDVLGAARDAEVLAARLVPEAEATGDVRLADDVRAALAADVAAARATLLAHLDGERHLALLRELDALVAPGSLAADGGVAVRGRRRLVRRELRRTRRAVREASESGALAPALHELRKAAKRARYAAETLAPAVGDRALAFAARMEAVQDALGGHQDDVVAQARLRELSDAALAEGRDTFGYGELHEAALRATDDEAYAQARAAVREAGRHWPARRKDR